MEMIKLLVNDSIFICRKLIIIVVLKVNGNKKQKIKDLYI